MGTLKFDFETSWVSVAAAAKELLVSRQRVYQLIKSGGVNGRRSGRTWLVSHRSVTARVELLRSEASAVDAGR